MRVRPRIGLFCFLETHCGQALVQELCARLVVRIRAELPILRKTLSGDGT
jgi:hypothetical protein